MKILLTIVSTLLLPYLLLLNICSFVNYVFWLEVLFAIFLSIIMYKNKRQLILDLLLFGITFVFLINCPFKMQGALESGILGCFLVLAIKQSFLPEQKLLSMRETVVIGSVSIFCIITSVLLYLSKFQSIYYPSIATPANLALISAGVIALCFSLHTILLLIKKIWIKIFSKTTEAVLLNSFFYSVILSTFLISIIGFY